MILIISEEKEKVTDDVLFYLLKNNVKFIRLNIQDLIDSFSIKFYSGKIKIFIELENKEVIDFDNILSIWYRRGGLNFSNDYSKMAKEDGIGDLLTVLYHHNHKSKEDVEKTFFSIITQTHYCLGNFNFNTLNKLHQAFIATKCGLKVADTIFSNNNTEVDTFFDDHSSHVITKSILERSMQFSFLGQEYSMPPMSTTKVSRDALKHKKFQISQFQKYQSKKYEIRTFVIENQIYSMAIFSQDNEQTKFDYRNYDYDNPNKYIAYKLPEHIEIKLLNFMKELGMNTGSADFIYTEDKEYIFLEINPAGQYDWLNKYCNYGIEQKIAQLLIEQQNKNGR